MSKQKQLSKKEFINMYFDLLKKRKEKKREEKRKKESEYESYRYESRVRVNKQIKAGLSLSKYR